MEVETSITHPQRTRSSPLPPQTFRQAVYAVLEEGQIENAASRIVEGLLVTLIIANVAAVALETVRSIAVPYARFLTAFEYFSIAAYTIEYTMRVWSSMEDPRIAARGPVKGRLAFALRPLMIVDFLAFAPSYLFLVLAIDLRVLRIFRLLRLVKLARYSQALPALLAVVYAQRSALFASFVLTLCVMCFSADLMHIAEGGVQPNVFGNMPEAMYWAITTLTTVGYGDKVPITPVGKLIAGVTEVTGLLLFALPIGILANGFVSDLYRRQFAITWSMIKRQPLLVGMEVQALTEIFNALSAKLVREHTQIAVIGQTANTLYLIASGQASLEGRADTYQLEPGDVFGQESLEVGATFQSTIAARSEMRLLVLAGDDLRRLANKYPLFRRRVANETAW